MYYISFFVAILIAVAFGQYISDDGQEGYGQDYGQAPQSYGQGYDQPQSYGHGYGQPQGYGKQQGHGSPLIIRGPEAKGIVTLKCPTFKNCRNKKFRHLKLTLLQSSEANVICVYSGKPFLWNTCNLSNVGSFCRIGNQFFGADQVYCNMKTGDCELIKC